MSDYMRCHLSDPWNYLSVSFCADIFSQMHCGQGTQFQVLGLAGLIYVTVITEVA